jgi:hypothetical protein
VTISSAARSAATDGLAINAINATATRNSMGFLVLGCGRIGRL